MSGRSEDFKSYQRFALQVCIDLEYGEQYEKRILDAETVNEIANILATARNAW